MAYNLPCGPGQTSFSGNWPNQLSFGQEAIMEADRFDQSMLDPALRQEQPQSTQIMWQQQQQPLQRYFNEPERNLFMAGPIQPRFLQYPGLTPRIEVISALPRANYSRVHSPSPSYYDSQESASATSPPAAEQEWYPETAYSPNLRDPFPAGASSAQFTQGLPEAWSEQPQASLFTQDSGYSFVNMNQVQGFADQQEVSFENDEGYIDMEKNEYAIEVDHTHQGAQHYHYRTSHVHDEGLGASIKDAESPDSKYTTGSHIDHDHADLDADAEADDDLPLDEPEPVSDTEYTPSRKTTRTRKRSLPLKPVTHTTAKKSRVTKNAKRSGLQCPQCDHAPFKDAVALQRHMKGAHIRAFVCVFEFAGCKSTFASKNEWKRHVSSQHLNLHSWVCEIGACGKAQGKNGGEQFKGSEFNRKDLFTQHLRRMHAPFSAKRQNKKVPDWEDKLKELQISCLRTKRSPPTKLACPVSGCGQIFDTKSCWDERMEHVAKHLEKVAQTGGVVEQERDHLLVRWAETEKIIERRMDGRYILPGAFANNNEADAEGEDDDEE
jgi:hypothetical protein